MTEIKGGTQFAFVDCTSPGNLKSQAVRTLIRKHAMKDVGATRRQSGSYGKHNLRQYPIFVVPSFLPVPDPGASEIGLSVAEDYEENPRVEARENDHGAQKDRRRQRGTTHKGTAHIDHTTVLISEHSRLLISSNFSILNLSPLTGLHLGIAKLSQFISDPTRIRDIFPFERKQCSLLSHLPSRYGQVACLTDAADCIVARVRWILNGDKLRGEADGVVRLYVKALRSLQTALDDAVQCLTPETLCATELLGIFELLDNSRGKAWIRHAGGAARLIEHRGPDRFKTEFEKALFMAHAGPIVTECLLNGTSCFLSQGPWQKVFHSAILPDDPFSDRSEIVIMLWTHLASGPDAFRETNKLICSDTPVSDEAVTALINRVLGNRNSLLNWYKYYQDLINSLNETGASQYPYLTSKICPGLVQRLTLHGTYLFCLILKSRLLVALSPSRFQDLEAQCQELADEILDLREQYHDHYRQLQGGLFKIQTLWIAKATTQTRDEWCEGIDSVENGGMIERWKFEKWCKALGRKVE